MNISEAETAAHDLLTQLRLDVNETHVGAVLSWLGDHVGLEGQPAAPAEAEGAGASDSPAPPAPEPSDPTPPPAA